jgi:hypothetical protein
LVVGALGPSSVTLATTAAAGGQRLPYLTAQAFSPAHGIA